MRALALLTAATALALAAGAAPVLAQIDPCAGQLDPSRIIECLKPGGLAPTTRGIRPAPAPTSSVPRPGTPAAPPPTASVNLTVPFAFDSAALTVPGTADLDALGVALKDPALASTRFRIAGHTDAKGADAYDQALSERRAEAARRYQDRLAAIGYGSTQLYDPANPAAAANRRVQVIRLEN